MLYMYSLFVTDGAGLGRRGCYGGRGDWTGVQDMFPVVRWGGVWGLISLSGKVGCGARVSCGLVDK